LFRVSIILALTAAIALGTRTAIAETSDKQATPSDQSAEEACATIRSALNELAQAERAQALALDLIAAPGNSTAMIESRLTTLLDRTSRLRRTLREVRRRSTTRDPRTEQCAKMGYHALTEAQKLASNVEELLRSPETGAAPAAGEVTSDAAPARSGARP
jgi:hypothetical protein